MVAHSSPSRSSITKLEAENTRLRKNLQQALEEIRRLKEEVGQLEEEKRRLKEEVGQLKGENARLKEQLAQLQEQLRGNSQNSSRPPSSDGPAKPKRPRRKPSGKKRGGQPGHEGRHRELLPPDECDAIHDHKPDRCEHCGVELDGDDPAPERHQVTETPPFKPLVEEHRLHALDCPCCGRKTRAALPEGVSRSCFGPRLVALVAVLAALYRQSATMTQEVLRTIFGVEISTGAIIELRAEASAAVEEAVAEAFDYVQEQPVVYADETGFKQGNADNNNPTKRKAWLWTAVTPLVTVFLVLLSRGQGAAKELLGDFEGILVSDRWSGYNWVPVSLRQLCWAHLKREFQKIAERPGMAGRLGKRLLALEGELFRFWGRVRDGTLSRAVFRIHALDIRSRLRALLEEGASWPRRRGDKGAAAKTSRTCAELLKLELAMWTFVYVEGVEPTNNHAERALRHAVIWRKISLGSQSEAGSVFVARMLTVVMSLRLQERNCLEFLVEAVKAKRTGSSAPSLLPMKPPISLEAAA
jgi:transposase